MVARNGNVVEMGPTPWSGATTSELDADVAIGGARPFNKSASD